MCKDKQGGRIGPLPDPVWGPKDIAWTGMAAYGAARGAMIRQMGGPGAQGFRPSILGMFSASFRSAPPIVKAATGVAFAAGMAATSATGVGPKEFVKRGMEHLQKPMDEDK